MKMIVSDIKNRIFIVYSVLLAIFYAYWAYTPITGMGTDVFLYLNTKTRMSLGLMPSIDYYSPAGIMNFYIFNFFDKINPAGSVILARLPFAVLFTYLMYRIRNLYPNYFLVLFLFGFFFITLYTPNGDFFFYYLRPTPNIYNDILVAIWFIGCVFILQKSVSIADYIIMGLLAFIALIIKAQGVIMVFAVMGFLFLYQGSHRYQHLLYGVLGFVIFGLVLHVIEPDYLPAYFTDLQIASGVKDKSDIVVRGIQFLLVCYILSFLSICILFRNPFEKITTRYFLMLSVLCGTYYIILGFSLYLYTPYRLAYTVFALGVFVMIVYRDNMQDMYVVYVKYMPFISYIGVGVVLLGSIYFGVQNYKQYKDKADLYPLNLPKITHYYTENTFRTILTAYYEGLQDFWDKGYFANNQKIVDLNTTNFADLWFNSTPSSYPVFMVIGAEFDKDSFPNLKRYLQMLLTLLWVKVWHVMYMMFIAIIVQGM